MLNNRQIRTLVDTLVPSPAQVSQRRQQQDQAAKTTKKKQPSFPVGTPCYALCYRPPGSTTRALGSSSRHPSWCPQLAVRVEPRGPVWRRHADQLRPRHVSDEDAEPGDELQKNTTSPPSSPEPSVSEERPPEYGPHNPRRSKRNRRPNPKYFGSPWGGEVTG